MIEKLGRAENKKGNSAVPFNSDKSEHFLDDENALQYAENEYAGVMNDGNQEDRYIENFEDIGDNFYTLLAIEESTNNYSKKIVKKEV